MLHTDLPPIITVSTREFDELLDRLLRAKLVGQTDTLLIWVRSDR